MERLGEKVDLQPGTVGGKWQHDDVRARNVRSALECLGMVRQINGRAGDWELAHHTSEKWGASACAYQEEKQMLQDKVNQGDQR